MVFVILSNYFRILTPQITGYVVNSVNKELRDNIAAQKTAAGNAEKAAGIGSPSPVKPGAAVPPGDAANTRDTVNYDILVRKSSAFSTRGTPLSGIRSLHAVSPCSCWP
jgi:hypothetical protein